MKLSKFVLDFKYSELNDVYFNIDEDVRNKCIDIINKYFNIEVEDRDIVLEDLDRNNGFIYKLLCEYYENEFYVKNGLSLKGYEYSIEDLFRDYFGRGRDMYCMFEVEDIDRRVYGK
jgi:hypothetical protein